MNYMNGAASKYNDELLRGERESAVLEAQCGALAEHGGCVLVGQQPNTATERRPELWMLPDDSGLAHTANRLLGYSGFTRQEFLRVFPVRTNAQASCGRFDLRAARRRFEGLLARVLVAQCEEPQVSIVLLGRRAWGSSDSCSGGAHLADQAPYTWVDIPGLYRPRARLAYVPHTSGMTRAYNTPEQRRACREFLQSLLGDLTR